MGPGFSRWIRNLFPEWSFAPESTVAAWWWLQGILPLTAGEPGLAWTEPWSSATSSIWSICLFLSAVEGGFELLLCYLKAPCCSLQPSRWSFSPEMAVSDGFQCPCLSFPLHLWMFAFVATCCLTVCQLCVFCIAFPALLHDAPVPGSDRRETKQCSLLHWLCRWVPRVLQRLSKHLPPAKKCLWEWYSSPAWSVVHAAGFLFLAGKRERLLWTERLCEDPSDVALNGCHSTGCKLPVHNAKSCL